MQSEEIKELRDKIADKETQIRVTTDVDERKLMRREILILRQQELVLIERERA